MLQSLLERLDSEHRDVAMAGVGMGALLLGRKRTALALFAAGLQGLERKWRQNHPEFKGGWAERWSLSQQFYEKTHQNPVNRWLHIVGIPMIAGGAAGLLLFRPFRPAWLGAAGAFTAGWALNFVGHGLFEKAAPAFRDDPLSFVAGPVWDLAQLRNGFRRPSAASQAEGGESIRVQDAVGEA